MRKETKTGIIIGIIITTATVIYFAQVDHGNNDNSQVNTLFEQPAENLDTQTEPEDSSPSSIQSQNNRPSPIEIENDITPVNLTETIASTEPDTNQPSSETPETIEDQNQTENQNVVKIEQPETKSNVDLDPFSNLPDEYPQQMNEPRYHSVKKGDSLFSISNEYFGNGKYWEAIYKANKDIITNASSLRIGWKLRIPSPEEIENN